MNNLLKKAGMVAASAAIMVGSMIGFVKPAGAANVSELGELIVLDNLFVNGGVTTDGKTSRLGELIVLDNLFADGGVNDGTRVSRLGELMVLDSLFR